MAREGEIVDSKTFPRALVMLFWRGGVRGELAMGRAEALAVLVMAVGVGVGAVMLAPFILARERLKSPPAG